MAAGRREIDEALRNVGSRTGDAIHENRRQTARGGLVRVMPPTEVRSGMMMKPPPRPTMDPRAEAAKPMHSPATVCRSFDTGGF